MSPYMPTTELAAAIATAIVDLHKFEIEPNRVRLWDAVALVYGIAHRLDTTGQLAQSVKAFADDSLAELSHVEVSQ